jgi:5-methylcytosine-specific restriction protein B
MIPPNITREHVLQALDEIAHAGVPAPRQSIDYFVEHEGKRYPPKYVISVANRYANGAELDPAAFPAGMGKGSANAFLQRLGLRVVRADGSPVERSPEGWQRANLEARRRDPAAARALFEDLLPDERVRLACLSFLADAIERSHAYGAARWGISLRQSRKVNLNLGRLLACGIRDDGISVGLHPDSVSEEDRALLDKLGAKLEPFNTAPEILRYRLPAERLVEIRDRIEAAYARFLERAAATALQTPYASAHSPSVLAYLREACARPLPDPSYSAAEKDDGVTEVDRIYWVNQGESYEEERNKGCIFAGEADAGDHQPGHGKLFSELREGDILVHNVSGEIRAVSRVEGPPAEAASGAEGAAREGLRVDVEYQELTFPIPLSQVVDDIAALEVPNGPLDRNRQPKQGQLWRFSAEGLDILRQARLQPWPAWAVPKHEPRAWIFQGNPEKYDLRGAVKSLQELSWMVKQYRNEVRPDDTVYLWEAGPEGGVVARGTALSRPEERPSDPAEAPFVRDASLNEEAAPRIRLRVDKLIDPPVSRARLKAHPALSGSAIMRMPQRTNFALSPAEARALAELIEGAAPPNQTESAPAPRPHAVNERPAIAPFDALMGTLERAKLYYSEELVSRYILALQAKRFVILTGISGTGKTQLALEVAKHFQAYITTERPAEIPEDAMRVRVSPYMLDYNRILIPAALAPKLAPRRADGSDRPTVRVAYGGREADLTSYRNPANGAFMFFFRSDFTAWFEEHFDVGDDIYLRAPGSDEGPGHRLEIIVPETTRLTEELENRAVVSVRPDWTDGRGLLGYYNPITRRYATTPFLRLLLRARDEHERATREGRAPQPFFAILDEMNLARVEHYFSDFLSTLESGEPLVLHDEVAVERGDPDAEEDAPLVPRSLLLPPNLFFTGTVNVDETTHMFSPKVLDRAFVIELNDVDLRGYGARARAQAALRLPGFEGLSRHGKPDTKDWDALGDVLDGALRGTVLALNDLLAQENRHFGFRVANEIARFVLLSMQQAPEHADILWTALDLAVLSKVLPKLSGTQQELEDLLERLFTFAVTGSDGPAPPDLASFTPRGGLLIRTDGGEERSARLPRTAAKLWRMRRRLERQGFTSFIE